MILRLTWTFVSGYVYMSTHLHYSCLLEQLDIWFYTCLTVRSYVLQGARTRFEDLATVILDDVEANLRTGIQLRVSKNILKFSHSVLA